MPGKLIVLARVEPRQAWGVVGAALSPAEAQDLVDRLGAQNAGARIVVAQVVRSFVITAQAAEDAIVTVDP